MYLRKDKNRMIPIKKLQKFNSLKEVEAWKTMRLSYCTIFNELESSLQLEGCSISKFQILYTLYFDGPLKQVKLAEQSKVTKSNISTFMKRIESEKLVRKLFVDQEKRPKFILTNKGEKFFERIFPIHVSNIKKHIKPMPMSVNNYLSDITKKCGDFTHDEGK